MKIRYAKSNEIENIKEIWNYCFDDSESFVDYYFKDKYNQINTIVVDDNGEIVSSLQLNQYSIILNNKNYDTSYVVGVSTFPHVRGKGYMRHIMKFTLDELYKKGQLVSILMPIDYRLYRQYGYEHCYDQLEYNINIEDLKSFKIKGDIYKVNKSYFKHLVDINNEFLNNINGSVKRDENYYENLIKEVKSENGHVYIHKDKEFRGYIIYFINGDNMFVREVFYKDIDSLKSMLKFIYNHNTQCSKVTISTPINDKIRLVLENPKTAKINIKPFMMGRLINVKKYLETLEIKSNLELETNISVIDNYLDENNKVFNIKLKNNKLIVNETNKKHDIELNINTLTQLAFSYIDIYDALIINNINKTDINKIAIDLLDTIFNKKDNYINEYI